MMHSLRASSFTNRITPSAVFALLPLLIVATAGGQEKQASKAVIKDGLSLTISLDKSEYRAGEPVTLSFVLKNVSDQMTFIGDGYLAPKYHEAGPSRHFEVHVTANGDQPLYFWSGTMTEGDTSGIRKVFRLDPGETYNGTICIFRPFEERQATKDRGGSFENKTTKQRHEFGKDGRKYSVVLRYQVNPKSHGVWKPPDDYSPERLWKGIVDSEPIELAILSE